MAGDHDGLDSSGAAPGSDGAPRRLHDDVPAKTGAPPPGPSDVVPRGWTREEWTESLYGTGASLRSRRGAFGRGFLLPVVLGTVLIVLLVLLLAR
ncbi:MAG TPA: hypothetical protein VFN50_08050 [Acidimicrobiales bacterium]|nr:hypothetical protein [Acidimicrobiales bacterium]